MNLRTVSRLAAVLLVAPAMLIANGEGVTAQQGEQGIDLDRRRRQESPRSPELCGPTVAARSCPLPACAARRWP